MSGYRYHGGAGVSRYWLTRRLTYPRLFPSGVAALVVFERSKPGWIVFDCPCVRGHRVMLNLDPERYPWWQNARLGSVDDTAERE